MMMPPLMVVVVGVGVAVVVVGELVIGIAAVVV